MFLNLLEYDAGAIAEIDHPICIDIHPDSLFYTLKQPTTFELLAWPLNIKFKVFFQEKQNISDISKDVIFKTNFPSGHLQNPQTKHTKFPKKEF